MKLSLSVPAHSSWHQSSHMTRAAPIFCLAHHQRTCLCRMCDIFLITIFFSRIDLDTWWSRNPYNFLGSLFFPVCQAGTSFVSLKILIIFPSTGNTLAFQLNLLTGFGLIFCFSKSVWSIYLQTIKVCWGILGRLWSVRSIIWGCLEGITTCDFRNESTKWGCLCCRFLSWEQCSCAGVVLFCCCIEIKVFKGCMPVALKPLVASFPVYTSRYALSNS
jgi:hypothetical protein